MEENQQVKEKEKLITSALEKVLQGGETNLKLALWELQKSRDIPARYINSVSSDEIFADTKAQIFIDLIESLTGFNKSKGRLICHLLEGANFEFLEEKTIKSLDKLKKIELRGFSRDFLMDQLPIIWLKSFKYDAIINALESSESKEEKDTLAKVLAIIGKI